MNYIGGDEMIFDRGGDGTITAGGFSVGNMLNRTGGVFTFNSVGGQKGGGVADLFQGLVIPCGLLYGGGGMGKENQYANDDSDEDDIIGDKLHDELLGLAKPVKKHGTKKHRTKLNRRKSAKNTK
jgi:hypothetical protein